MISLQLMTLQLFAKEDRLRKLCRQYPNGCSMTAHLRVASHTLDEPPSKNPALELAKAIILLRRQLEELESAGWREPPTHN